MTIFINRSIPLSEESRNGWTSAGAVVLSRDIHRRNRQLVSGQAPVLINLGLVDVPDFKFNSVWNEHDSIRAILSPAAIRRTLPNLIPPWPNEGEPYWVKGPGERGHNKSFHPAWPARFVGAFPKRGNYDYQRHIEGTEFRVLTVGNMVVQAYKKLDPINGVRQWEWVGVKGIKDGGIIPLVKAAVALVPNGGKSVFGWDVISNKTATYIIEGNSSPGVSAETAVRIVKQISRMEN